MSANEYVAWHAPPFSIIGGMLSRNGVQRTPADFIQSTLDTNGGDQNLALAMIFRMAASQSTFDSEKLDQYGYSVLKFRDYCREQAAYWDLQSTISGFGDSDMVPTVQPGGILGLPIFPLPPAIR